MVEAARWLWFEAGIAAEMSGAAAMAALRLGRVATTPAEKICVLVCGAGTDGIGQP
jgi:threonine dehydratase